MEENEKYLATIPVYRRIDAVYVNDIRENEEDIKIYRAPVVAIQVTCEENYRHTYIFHTPLIALGGDGTIEEMESDRYFLGLEFDGKQEDWSKEIAKKKEIWRKIEERKRELKMKKVAEEKTKKN